MGHLFTVLLFFTWGETNGHGYYMNLGVVGERGGVIKYEYSNYIRL